MSKRRKFSISSLVLLLVIGFASTGCVETKRTQKSKYGSPTGFMSGPDREFDAEKFGENRNKPKPWYDRLIFW